jgi:segregation and condensation protein B
MKFLWRVEMMLTRAPCPAGQLHSVAGRYRPPVAPRGGGDGTAVRQHRSWRLGVTGPPAVTPTATPNGRDHRLQRLEAVLYLAREPLTTRKLSQYANLSDGTEARTLIRRLNDLYDRSGRAYRVERIAGGYQLMTRPQLATWIRRLGHVPHETRLSAPALETLAVIAYRQPVLRSDIEAIRGVNCGEILRQLMERDLVRIGGRSEELGRPFLYATTKRFLCLYGLESLERLPRVEVLRPSGAGNPSGPGGQEGLHEQRKPGEIEACQEAAFLEEDLKMSSMSLSGRRLLPASAEEEILTRPPVEAFDEEQDEEYEDYDEGEDEEDEEEDDDFEDEDLDEDEDFDDEDFDEEDDFEDDEDFEDEEWEEVDEGDGEVDEDEDDDEEEWDDDESDWDYEDEDEEEDEEEEEEDGGEWE